VSLVLLLARAAAQEPPADAAATEEGAGWGGRASLSYYYLPHDSDFLVAIGAADHGALHLEARYGYEDRRTASFFAGWNLGFGEAVRLDLVPMIGAAVGRTGGILPALELTLAWGPLEYYVEAEVLVDLADTSSSYFYAWSELSVAPVPWARVGVALQRTRVVHTGREITPGVLLGFSVWRLDLTAYWFDPGADGQYAVVSAGVSF
jgi:hypothetical protein